MKISQRELILGWTTGLVVLCAFSYWLLQPRLAIQREMRAYQQALETQILQAQRLVEQQPDWLARLAKLKQNVTAYPLERDVTADYLRLIERLATENNLTLLKRNAQKEKTFGDLKELTIDCTWEGDLAALVRFMYALEKSDMFLDMEELSVSMTSGKEGKLKGSFNVLCIYSRAAGTDTNTQAAATAPASQNSVSNQTKNETAANTNHVKAKK